MNIGPRLMCCLAVFSLFSSGCDSAPSVNDIVSIGKSAETLIRIKRVPMRMMLTAGVASMTVLVEELSNLGIDSQDLLDQVVEHEKTKDGIPTTEFPTLLLIHKTTNTARYWQLHENVKSISLKTKDSNEVELKVINESPLRVEMWIDGEMDFVDVTIEMKN